jgi:hypothetical protein
MVSWTDLTMRHGRKSASGRWNGAKIPVGEDPETELITAIEVVDASAGDGKGPFKGRYFESERVRQAW